MKRGSFPFLWSALSSQPQAYFAASWSHLCKKKPNRPILRSLLLVGTVPKHQGLAPEAPWENDSYCHFDKKPFPQVSRFRWCNIFVSSALIDKVTLPVLLWHLNTFIPIGCNLCVQNVSVGSTVIAAFPLSRQCVCFVVVSKDWVKCNSLCLSLFLCLHMTCLPVKFDVIVTQLGRIRHL